MHQTVCDNCKKEITIEGPMARWFEVQCRGWQPALGYVPRLDFCSERCVGEFYTRRADLQDGKEHKEQR